MTGLLARVCAVGVVAAVAGSALGAVYVPDNGGGTIDFPPPGGAYVVCPGFPQFSIINGLPAGSTIQIDPTLSNWTSVVETAGGALAGDSQTFDFQLDFVINGTGAYNFYSRNLTFPLFLTSGKTDIAPRTPFAALQTFAGDWRRLQTQITGDPDFDLLRITAGTEFGLPSPGSTTITQSGPGWLVDSFFDLTYRIDFIGAPGGPFAGLSGSTTGQTRIWLVPTPGVAGLMGLGGVVMGWRRRR